MSRVATGATHWALLPHFLVRSTGFPVELLDRARMPASAARCAEVLRAQRRLETLAGDFETVVLPAALQREQARSGSGKVAFRPWYRLRRATGRRVPCPAELAAELAGRDPGAGRWLASWAGAHDELQAAGQDLARTFNAELGQMRAALHAITTQARFREALFLSNPDIDAVAVPYYLRHFSPSARPSKIRHIERRLYAYLQRFCAKNDTTSYFGPVDFARVEPTAGGGLELERDPAGPPSRRLTRLSYWAAQALADAVSRDPEVLPRLVPRLADGLRPAGPRSVHVVGRGTPVPLPEAAARVLPAADGKRSVDEVAAAAATSRGVVQRLAERGLLRLALQIPTAALDPLGWLRQQVAQLPAPTRDRWLRELDPLCRDLAGFPDAPLERKRELLTGIEDRFTRLTGQQPTRGDGATYADRGVLYDEAVGDFTRCAIGAPMAGKLAADLTPALDLCASYSLLVQAALERRAAAELARLGGGPVPYLDFAALLQERLPPDGALGDPAVAQFVAALSRLVRIRERDGVADLSAHDIAPLLLDVPPGTAVSPDIFLLAPTLAALRRGDYSVVVGEVHHGHQVWSHFLALHPDRDSVGAALGAAVPAPPPGARYAGLVHARRQGKAFPLEPPGLAVEVLGRSGGADVVPVADLEVILDGDARPALRSISLGCPLLLHPRDPRAAVNWLFGPPPVGAPPVRLSSPVPRVRVGPVVLARRRWRVSVETLRLGAGGAALLLAAAQLREHHQLPERCFARVSRERKPLYVDFGSLLSLEQLTAETRENPTVDLTEMLPAPQDWWLRGPGTRSNEWRLTAVREAS